MSTTLQHRFTAPADPSLPSPPDDADKYAYLTRQHRWVLWAQALSFILIAISIARFAVGDLRMLLFLIPMSLYAVTMVISLVSSTQKRRVTLDSHQDLVRWWLPPSWPSVDVFLPSAGEPLDLLANTFSHVNRLDWDGDVTVWVLDDSARPEVQRLAELYGFEYRTRPNRGFLKKAGNLRFGYDQSDADYIAIFDADFVPRPDYLRELLPYFDDESIGIVQSPQYFDTKTPGMHWLQRCAGATQELFYRWIQPSRDRAGAAICVGTCAIYRRAGLVKAGGFAQIGHSEDVHTGVKLLKVGYRVQYVPVLVSKGVCPDTLSGFLNQQYRWCTGSMSLLADKTFHEAKAITWRMKICFWAGFLYYISTGVNAFVAALPGLAMLWLLPDWVEPMNSIWLVGALVLWFGILPAVMHGRWRVEVVRVQHLYSFAHAVAIVHILTGRTKEWVATGAANKRTTPLAATITRTAKTYVAISQILIWVGLIRGTMTYGLENYWAMLLFGALSSYLQLPILAMKQNPGDPALRVKLRAFLLTRVVYPLRGFRPVSAVPMSDAPASVAPASVAPAALPPAPPAPPPIFGSDSPTVIRPAAPGPRRFRPDIQGLRTIAVVLVVLYHASVPGITGGYVGVDVFFVISGFLITGQLLREVERTGRIAFLSFYGARMRRLLPPAAIVVVATLVAARFVDSILHVKSVALDAVFTSIYAMNYRLAYVGVDYQNANGPESPLQHMWSLSVEEQFYVVWPLLIAVTAWLGGRHRKQLLLAVLLGGMTVSFYLSVTQTVSNPPLAYFGLHTRAWELALGAVVAMAATRLSRMPGWISITGSWAGLLAICGSGLLFTDETPFPGSAALVPTLGAALVIAAGCRFASGGAESVLGRKPFQGIGAVSYGWYLWHWPLIVLVPLAAGTNLTWPYQLEVMGVALWLAVLTYYVVEKPSLRSMLQKRVWLLGGGLSAAMVTAGALAIVMTIPTMVGAGRAASAVDLNAADSGQVKQAITDGLSVMVTPSNLKPSVVSAINDQPKSSFDGCHAEYAQVAQPECIYGDPDGEHTLVLFGDSHAQQWLPALDAQGLAEGWKVVAWTKAACPVADVQVVNDALGRVFTECVQWRTETMQRIIAMEPDMVVVSQSDTVPGTQVTNAAWGDQTAASLVNFKAADIPVAYVLDTPYLATSAPDCVAAHLQNVGACNLPRDDVMPYGGRRTTLDAALTSANITTIDTMDWFCTSTTCPVVVGDILVYRDASHMSAQFSRWLGPMVKPLFVARNG